MSDVARGSVAIPPAVHADPTLTIRLAHPPEYAEAARVSVRAYEHDYEIGPGYRAELDDVAGHARLGDVWIARDDVAGRIVATVWAARAGERLAAVARAGEMDFRLLAVDPDDRGRGLGAAMTHHLLDLARQRGATRLVMNSGEQMVGAHRLYAKLGFRRLDERAVVKEVDGRRFRVLAFGYDLV